MPKAKQLLAGLALAVLLVAGAGAVYAISQRGSMTDGNGMGSMMGNRQMDSTMNGGDMSGGQMMGSFDEEKPFDLQFIDQMIMHHEGAIMSSEHMIANSERPELRQLAENIQKSQSEQIEQMQEWREQWYGNAEQTFGTMDSTQMEKMMGEGHMEEMMGGSMQEMMGGDMSDEMFLRMMIPHHQIAIDMSEQALERAEHPKLKELAQTIIDEQSVEIGLMKVYLEEIDAADGR